MNISRVQERDQGQFHLRSNAMVIRLQNVFLMINHQSTSSFLYSYLRNSYTYRFLNLLYAMFSYRLLESLTYLLSLLFQYIAALTCIYSIVNVSSRKP